MAKSRETSPARFIKISRGPHCDKRPEPVRVVQMAKTGPAYFAAIEKELVEVESELAGMMDHIQDFGGPDILRQVRLETRQKIIITELNSRNINQRSA